jgi:hypothetical protein
MGNEIDLSPQEATDLLSKWMTENRVIHLTLKSGVAISKIVGRIDGIAKQGVHFSATKSKSLLGEYNLAQFSLDGCRFQYSDAKDAPEWLRAKLLGSDALLYIYYFDSAMILRTAIGLAVLPVDEWPEF